MHNAGVFDELLNEMNVFEDSRLFTMKYYYRKWSHFEEAIPGTIKLIPNNNNLNELRKDYEMMKVMIYGEKPSFDDIIKTIKIMEGKLNEYNK
jgi:hypothetical protein